MPKKKSLARAFSSADRFLLALAYPAAGGKARRDPADRALVAELVAADLAAQAPNGALDITQAGRARAARLVAGASKGDLDPFLAQHLAPAKRRLAPANRPAADDAAAGRVTINEAESPLAWLARRKGRDGASLIAPAQLQAGERLRAEFTRAQLTPRVTSNWSGVPSQGGGASALGSDLLDAAIAARQRLRAALDAVGPEFAGLLLDVCCFLKGLEEVERERQWPTRSAKVVLQLGLDRLARHYGYEAQARGPAHAAVRTWLARDALADLPE